MAPRGRQRLGHTPPFDLESRNPLVLLLRPLLRLYLFAFYDSRCVARAASAWGGGYGGAAPPCCLLRLCMCLLQLLHVLSIAATCALSQLLHMLAPAGSCDAGSSCMQRLLWRPHQHCCPAPASAAGRRRPNTTDRKSGPATWDPLHSEWRFFQAYFCYLVRCGPL